MELFKSRLRSIIEDHTTRKGRVFDFVIQFLILLSLVSFSIETLPDNSVVTKKVLSIIEYICVIVFSIEYVLRIYVAKKPFKYIFSFYGLVDLLSILPFYLTSTIDLRAFRIFRIFRVFRAFKLIRYNKALRRFSVAYSIIKEEVILFLWSH